jgi:PAS domain S-box-containing protein
MDAMTSSNIWLAGFFACGAIHYASHWWASRKEHVLLVFSLQCAAYAIFCLAFVSYLRARTLSDVQTTHDRFYTIGVLIYPLLLQLYASVGARRDRVFRVSTTVLLVFFALLNLWAPMRGTVVELKTIQLPDGAPSVIPIRTSLSAVLPLVYLAVLAVQGYGFFVARAIWKRDRPGAVLVAGSTASILAGVVLAILIDFAKVRAPYVGAWPHAILVVGITLFLSREYAARGARVAAAQRQFQAAFEHTPIGKALIALDGRFLEVNRALCRILGRSSEELSASRLGDVTHPDDGDEPQFQRLREVPAYVVEKRFVRADGEPVWALLAVSVVPDDQGRPVQIIAQLQDMTELRGHRERLEELVATRTRELEAAKNEAERANRAKSDFLAHISHEIRTPLHVLLAYAQNLDRDPALGEAQRSKVEIVNSSGKHLQALINDVLEMSQIEAGRLELVENPFDPWATLVEVQRMFADEAAAKGVELLLERSSELPGLLLGDGAKVKQILINLASNALKFTSQGSIRLEASWSEHANGSILSRIVVSDTGVGIAQQDAARIFQPFEQLEVGKQAGGTGLGLAIGQAQARRMGGDLSVQSAPGAGSAFTFSYLAKSVGTQVTSAPRTASAIVPSGATGCKVLIVDDHALSRDILSVFLSGLGFQTRTAVDGAGALSLHADWQPELVLIDLRMSGIGGLEAIRRMRAAGSSAAIGVLSASALDEDERLACAVGADFFLRKPYEYSELQDRIALVLADTIGTGAAPPSAGSRSGQELATPR